MKNEEWNMISKTNMRASWPPSYTHRDRDEMHKNQLQ